MSCTRNIRQADPYYEGLNKKVADALQMNPIAIYEADSMNACATTDSWGQQIITYDPSLLTPLHFENRWAPFMIVAHEYGHHRHGDLYTKVTNYQDAWNKELNADWIAGWTLRKLGASLTDARSVFRFIEFTTSESHPPEEKREDSLIQGWQRLDNELRAQKRRTENAIVGVAAGSLLLLLLVGLSSK